MISLARSEGDTGGSHHATGTKYPVPSPHHLQPLVPSPQPTSLAAVPQRGNSLATAPVDVFEDEEAGNKQWNVVWHLG